MATDDERYAFFVLLSPFLFMTVLILLLLLFLLSHYLNFDYQWLEFRQTAGNCYGDFVKFEFDDDDSVVKNKWTAQDTNIS